jgi:hypothetical protein
MVSASKHPVTGLALNRARNAQSKERANKERVMRALLALGKSADIASLPNAVVIGRSRPSFLARLRDIWAVCRRANAAAHTYEDLKPLSDAELAARGFTRMDLPRAALRKLTGEA